jgi:cell division protein FtsB
VTLSLYNLVAKCLPGRWQNPLRSSSALAPGRVGDLSKGLEAEKSALFSFTAEMEQEFLELGKLLRRITALARDVRGRSDEITAAATGRTEDAAIQFAFQLLKKAEDVVHASREQHNSVSLVFEKMHVEIMQIARGRSALGRTLSPLGMTITQFRIQACAFEETTRERFFALADSIGSIVHDVRSAVGQRFEELERTGEATGAAVTRLTSLATEQKAETERMLAETRRNLSALNQALQASEAVAQSMSHAGLRISGGVGKAIVALQCQDMARQKLQHIGQAIDEMVGHLASGSIDGFTGAEETDCRCFLADAGRVQLMQLRSLFEQLDEAGQEVARGLGEVDSEAKAMADHALRTGGATLDGEIIGQAIRSIHAVLVVSENATVSIRSVVDLVQKLKSTFNDCTSQIRDLALKLRIVALNAQIFAAHVSTGASLEVVASNTRSVADEAMQQLDEISTRVTEVVDSVADLEQRLDDYQELATMEQALLSNESAEAEKKLRMLEQGLRNALGAIALLERDLSDTICSTTGSIRFPVAVSKARTRATALFEQIVRQYSESSDGTEGASHSKVQELNRNYTMAHERAVHAAVVLTPGAEDFDPAAHPEGHDDMLVPIEEGEATPEGAIDDEELAGNVELF